MVSVCKLGLCSLCGVETATEKRKGKMLNPCAF